MRYSRDGYTLPELLFFISMMGVSAAFFSPLFSSFRHAGNPVAFAAVAAIGTIVAFWIAFAGFLWAIAGTFKLLFFRRTPWKRMFHELVKWVSIVWLALSFVVALGTAVWYLVELLL